MRIVIVGPFGMAPRGTMAVRALPMAKALVARGHRVTVLLPPWQNPQDAGRRWEEEGVAVENIALPPRAPGLFHLLTVLRLTRRTLALRPDVVHLAAPFIAGYKAASVASTSNCPASSWSPWARASTTAPSTPGGRTARCTAGASSCRAPRSRPPR